MKIHLLIAAAALVAPAASLADHHRSYSSGGYHHSSHGYRPYYRPYGYYPYGYYGGGPVVSFNFSSRPAVYSGMRYYAPGESSLEASVQRALRREGYYEGPLDGDIGPRSRSAIREYQVDNRLSVTGRIDSRLLRALGI